MDREVIPQTELDQPTPAVAARPSPRLPPAVAAALGLQRGAGNRAAARVLARRPAAAPAVVAEPAPVAEPEQATPELDAEQARGLDLDLVLEDDHTVDPYADTDFEPPAVPEAATEPGPYVDVDFEPPRVPETGAPEADPYADVDFEPPAVPEADPYADVDREPPAAKPASKPKPKRRKPRRRRSTKPSSHRGQPTVGRPAPTPTTTGPTTAPAQAKSAAPPATAPPAAAIPSKDLDAALARLHAAINAGPSGAPRALEVLLAWSAHAPELRRRYQQLYRLDLVQCVDRFGPAGAARARDLLNFGRLRPITKLLLALDGWSADTVNLFRILTEVHADGQWDTRFKTAARENPELAWRFGGMTVSQALGVQLSGPELLKARAVLNQGAMRPVDKIYNALKHMPYLVGADRALLFEGLAAANPSTILSEFAAYPGSELGKDLLKELEEKLRFMWRLDDEYLRALALVGYERNGDGKVVPRTTGGRAVALVRVAVREVGTNHALLWPTVEEGAKDPAQRKELQAWVRSEEARSELDAADLARFKEMVGVAEGRGAAGLDSWLSFFKLDPAVLSDPAVATLRRLGGVDAATVFDHIKLAPVAELHQFARAYGATGSPFRRYVDFNIGGSERDRLPTVLGGTLRKRLALCFGGTFRGDDEDYLFHLLGVHATDAERRSLSADQAFMAQLRSALSTTELTKARGLLRPKSETADEAARYQRETLPAERHRLLDWLTGSGAALEDEDRELQTRVRDADRVSEERRRLQAAGRVDAARADYIKARDELNAVVEQTIGTAAGLVATFLTAGAASSLLIANMSRVSMAIATQKWVTAKLVRGEQFDAFGGDGAQLLAVGAVDGVMNVLGGVFARGVTGSAIQSTHELFAARLSIESEHFLRAWFLKHFELFANSTLSGVVSGTVVGSVDALSREATYRDGWDDVFQRVAKSAHEKALVGAVNGATLKVGARTQGQRRRARNQAAERDVD